MTTMMTMKMKMKMHTCEEDSDNSGTMKVARYRSREENLLGVLNQLGLSLLEDSLPSRGLGRAAR